MNKEKAIKEIKKASEIFYACDYIKTKVAESIISKINEPQKVTIPEFVAEWLKESRHADKLVQVLNAVENEQVVPSIVNDWIFDNQRDFVIAWLDGYEIEKEPLYTVEIPNPNLNAHVVLQKKWGGLVLVTLENAGWAEWDSSKLTEAEIKEDFDFLWKFAKHVEV